MFTDNKAIYILFKINYNIIVLINKKATKIKLSSVNDIIDTVYYYKDIL